MQYIQRKDYQFHTLETVDQFDTAKEARAMVREYRIADQSADYYISTRPCRNWNEVQSWTGDR